jgi:lipopolysaccharide export system permease protein
MKTTRRLIYGEIQSAVVFVTLCFLALFFFFDFVDEIPALGKSGPHEYQLRHAFFYVCMQIPNRIYELLPITVLIGSIFVMSRLAQSSEFTILRTSGLGPWKALRMLMGIGLIFTLVTFAVGDYISPVVNRSAQLMKAHFTGSLSVGQTGAWLKEKQSYSNYAVNVGAMSAAGEMKNIRIFEFNNKGFLVSTIQAERGSFSADEDWVLGKAEITEFQMQSEVDPSGKAQDVTAAVRKISREEFHWPTTLSNEMVSTALLRPDRMKTIDLFQYIRHLQSNGQSAQKYEIEFWRKVFYPLSCLVMVIFSLPFAYLHFRKGAATGYIFVGVMIGISFFLLNNVFGFIGNLRNWEPWIAAGSPGALYLLASLSAFGWLVLKR